MFWINITKLLSFTGIKEFSVWQDIFFGVLLIPLAIELSKIFFNWLDNKKPLKSLFKDFLHSKYETLIFLSQLSAIDENKKINFDQRYIIKYPNPLPTAKSAISFSERKNIDPVWAEGDGECLADVFNALGRANKIDHLRLGDSVKDWDKWSNPTISIGFTIKTHKLIEKCNPIYFKLTSEKQGTLSIKGSDIKLDAYHPNEAGVIQKSYIKGTNAPVFILAGLGTMGTSIAGYFFSQNSTQLGKLYGNNPFCILVSVKTDEGRTSVIARSFYPKPKILNIIFHIPTYLKYKNLFNKNSN